MAASSAHSFNRDPSQLQTFKITNGNCGFQQLPFTETQFPFVILKVTNGNCGFQQLPFTETLALRAAPKRIALREDQLHGTAFRRVQSGFTCLFRSSHSRPPFTVRIESQKAAIVPNRFGVSPIFNGAYDCEAIELA